jgi:hypothetical protein
MCESGGAICQLARLSVKRERLPSYRTTARLLRLFGPYRRTILFNR